MPSTWQRTTQGYLTQTEAGFPRQRDITLNISMLASANTAAPSKIIGVYTGSPLDQPNYTSSAGFEQTVQGSSQCYYARLQVQHSIQQISLNGPFTTVIGSSTLYGWNSATFRLTRTWRIFSPHTSGYADNGNTGYTDITIPLVYPLTIAAQGAEIRSRAWAQADYFEVTASMGFTFYTREIFTPKATLVNASPPLPQGFCEFLYNAEGTVTTPNGTAVYPQSLLFTLVGTGLTPTTDISRIYALGARLEGYNRTGTTANFQDSTRPDFAQWTAISGVSNTRTACNMTLGGMGATLRLTPADVPLMSVDGDTITSQEMLLTADSGRFKILTSQFSHTPQTDVAIQTRLRRMKSFTAEPFHGRIRLDTVTWTYSTGLGSTPSTTYFASSGTDPDYPLSVGGTYHTLFGPSQYFTPGTSGYTTGNTNISGEDGPLPRCVISSISCEQVDNTNAIVPSTDPFQVRLFPTFQPVEVWRETEKTLFANPWVVASSTSDTDVSKWWGSSPPTVSGGSVLALQGPVTVHYNFSVGWNPTFTSADPRYRVMPSPTLIIRLRSVGSENRRVKLTFRGPVVYPRLEFPPDGANANDIQGLKLQISTGADGVWVERTLDLLSLNATRPAISVPIDDSTYNAASSDLNELRAVAIELLDSGTVEVESVRFVMPEAGVLSSCYPRLAATTFSTMRRNDLWASAFLTQHVRGFPAWHQQWRRNSAAICSTIIVQLQREVERAAFPSYANLTGVNAPSYVFTEFCSLRMAELLPPRSSKPRAVPFSGPPYSPGTTTYPWAWGDLFDTDAAIECIAGDGLMVMPVTVTTMAPGIGGVGGGPTPGFDQLTQFLDVPCGDTGTRVAVPSQYSLPGLRVYPGAGEIGNSGKYPAGYGATTLTFWALHGGGAVGSLISTTAPVALTEYQEGFSGGIRFITPPRDAGSFAPLGATAGMPGTGEHAADTQGLRGVTANGWDDGGIRRSIINRANPGGLWPGDWRIARNVRERINLRFWKSLSGGLALAISRTGRIVCGEIADGGISTRRWDGLAFDSAVTTSSPSGLSALSLLWRQGLTTGSQLLAGVVVSGSAQIWRSDDEGRSWTLVTTLGSGTDVALCGSATNVIHSYRIGDDSRLYLTLTDSRDTDLVGTKQVVNSSGSPITVGAIGLDAIWDSDRGLIVLTYVDDSGSGVVATTRNGWELL